MPNNYNNPFMYNPNPYQTPYVPNYSRNYPTNTYAYVNGIEGARSYQVAPGQSVMLMDSDNPLCYLKQADNTGRATIRSFKLEEIVEKEEPKANIEYVSKSDFDALSNKLNEVLKKLEEKENG